MEKLSSASHGIDKLLGGGLPQHQICLIYGEAATGKTILAMQFAVEAARKQCKIFYVDSDQSFSSNRVERLVNGNYPAENIVLFRPEDFREQGRILDALESHLTKTPTLLIVDSITGLYRTPETGGHEFFGRDRDLNRQLAHLSGLTARFALWVLLIGQVHSTPSRGEWIVEPVATRTLRHWSDLIIRLRQTPRQGIRDCVLEKKKDAAVTMERCLFRITEDGVEEA